MFLGVQTFLDAGVPIADQIDSVLAAIADARADLGIDGALLITSQRHRPQAAALEVLDLIQPWGDRIAAHIAAVDEIRSGERVAGAWRFERPADEIRPAGPAAAARKP